MIDLVQNDIAAYDRYYYQLFADFCGVEGVNRFQLL